MCTPCWFSFGINPGDFSALLCTYFENVVSLTIPFLLGGGQTLILFVLSPMACCKLTSKMVDCTKL
jgi:hypothetical protein